MINLEIWWLSDMILKKGGIKIFLHYRSIKHYCQIVASFGYDSISSFGLKVNVQVKFALGAISAKNILKVRNR
jgi:hypothetical protein